MKVIKKSEFRTLAFLLILLFILQALFGFVSAKPLPYATSAWQQIAAGAAACNNDSFGDLAGSVTIPHEICQDPKATTCGPISLGTAGTISTVCSAGCCKAVSYSVAPTGSGSSTSFLTGILSNVAVQLVSSALSNLFSGGSSGGGSYVGNSGIEFRDPTEEQSYLEFTQGTSNEDPLDVFSLAFGTGGAEKTTETQVIHSTERTGGVVQDQGSTDESSQATTKRDSITTSYEYRSSAQGDAVGGVAPIPGEGELEQDFFGGSFNSVTETEKSGGLTRAELELEAQVRKEREVQQYESLGVQNTGNLRDYRSSNVARSDDPIEINPLSNSRFDGLNSETQEEKTTWWQSLLLLIGKVLGFTN